MRKTNLPVVGILCDLEQLRPHPFHISGNKYIEVVIQAANCTPILIPAIAGQANLFHAFAQACLAKQITRENHG